MKSQVLFLVVVVLFSVNQADAQRRGSRSQQEREDISDDQQAQIELVQNKADVKRELQKVRETLKRAIEKKFGPDEPGNEDYSTAEEQLNAWFNHEINEIAPYLAWPDTYIPMDVSRSSVVAGHLVGSRDHQTHAHFEEFWRQHKLESSLLRTARKKIVAAYKQYPGQVTQQRDDLYMFHNQLLLELSIREKLTPELTKQFRDFPWQQYLEAYYQKKAGIKSKDVERGLSFVKKYKEHDKLMKDLGLTQFRDRWQKKVKEKYESK